MLMDQRVRMSLKTVFVSRSLSSIQNQYPLYLTASDWPSGLRFEDRIRMLWPANPGGGYVTVKPADVWSAGTSTAARIISIMLKVDRVVIAILELRSALKPK